MLVEALEGQRKMKKNVHVPCMALRAAHPINMLQMLKCTVRKKESEKGSTVMLLDNRPAELRLDAGFLLTRQQTEAKIREATNPAERDQ